MRKIMQRAAALLFAGVLTVVICIPAAAAPAKEVDLDGKYHASLGIQTATVLWAQHMAYYDKTQNKTFGTDEADKLISESNGEKKVHDGTFTDVEIAGNGTYTVKLEDADFAGETCISQLHIATDIPVNDKIKFTDVTATIDGKKVLSFDEGWMENEDPYIQGGEVVVLLNHWREELIKVVQSQGKSEDADNGYTLLTGSGKESIEVQFTVAGFNYDNPDAVAATPTPAPTVAADTSSSNSSNSIPAGAVVAIVVVAVVVIGGIVIACVSRKGD